MDEEELYENTQVGNTTIIVGQLEQYMNAKGSVGLQEEFFVSIALFNFHTTSILRTKGNSLCNYGYVFQRLKRGNIKDCVIGARESKVNHNRYRNIIPCMYFTMDCIGLL